MGWGALLTGLTQGIAEGNIQREQFKTGVEQMMLRTNMSLASQLLQSDDPQARQVGQGMIDTLGQHKGKPGETAKLMGQFWKDHEGFHNLLYGGQEAAQPQQPQQMPQQQQPEQQPLQQQPTSEEMERQILQDSITPISNLMNQKGTELQSINVELERMRLNGQAFNPITGQPTARYAELSKMRDNTDKDYQDFQRTVLQEQSKVDLYVKTQALNKLKLKEFFDRTGIDPKSQEGKIATAGAEFGAQFGALFKTARSRLTKPMMGEDLMGQLAVDSTGQPFRRGVQYQVYTDQNGEVIDAYPAASSTGNRIISTSVAGHKGTFKVMIDAVGNPLKVVGWSPPGTSSYTYKDPDTGMEYLVQYSKDQAMSDAVASMLPHRPGGQDFSTMAENSGRRLTPQDRPNVSTAEGDAPPETASRVLKQEQPRKSPTSGAPAGALPKGGKPAKMTMTSARDITTAAASFYLGNQVKAILDARNEKGERFGDKGGIMDKAKGLWEYGKYKAGFAADDPLYQVLIPLTSLQRVMVSSPYLRGLRNMQWVHQIQEHALGPTDTPALMSQKLPNMLYTLQQIVQDIYDVEGIPQWQRMKAEDIKIQEEVTPETLQALERVRAQMEAQGWKLPSPKSQQLKMMIPEDTVQRWMNQFHKTREEAVKYFEGGGYTVPGAKP